MYCWVSIGFYKSYWFIVKLSVYIQSINFVIGLCVLLKIN